MTIIRHRAGTTAQWASPTQGVLRQGEFGKNTDTGEFKMGDGVTQFDALPTILTSDTVLWSLIKGKPIIGGQRIGILDRVNGPIFGGTSDGTKQGTAWRFAYPVIKSGHSLEFVFSNVRNTGGPEGDGQNTLTFFAAVEAPDGSIVRVTPVGGTTLLAGQQIKLPVGMEVVAGQTIYLRTQVSVPVLGQTWGLGSQIYMAPNADGVLDTSGAPATDITTSASAASFAYTGGQVWGPIAVTAICESPTPSVLIVGTSIAYGIGNTAGPDQSYITQALKAANIPFQNTAMPSSSALQFSTIAGRSRKMAAVVGTRHTHAIWEHITNDAGVSTIATIKANSITGWRVLSARGLKVWALTGVPKTNAANTVQDGGNSNRVAYNNWLRDGAPMTTSYVASAVGASGGGVIRAGNALHPLAGYFEVADIVESARDSGYWVSTALSSDGIHPTTLGHTNLRAAINTTKFTI